MDDNDLDRLEDILVSGIRDFMGKTGFKKAHLGLSGGIDSAIVAYLAVKAVGSENITCISMPSRFSSEHSKTDAAALAENIGCRYEILPIENCYTAFLSTLEGIFKGLPFDLAEENLQARIRGVMLMAFSNKFNSMLLNASNKSEIAMGYCTLYGDTIGALSPIGDVFKTDIFALCKRINSRSAERGGEEIIPRSIIEKAPSAELRPDQKDEDSLPPYGKLDGVLRLYLMEKLSRDEIVGKGWDAELTDSIINTHAKTEFKRRQLPPAIMVNTGSGLS